MTFMGLLVPQDDARGAADVGQRELGGKPEALDPPRALELDADARRRRLDPHLDQDAALEGLGVAELRGRVADLAFQSVGHDLVAGP